MSQEPKQKKIRGGSVLPVLLLAVAVLFTVTSGMLGFLLGRNASAGTGELMDTIVVSRERGSAAAPAEIVHFLSGRVLYAEGSPCSGATVRLKDSEKTDETDENGKFFFSDIGSGTDTLEVLDGSGKLLADTPVTFRFRQEMEIRAELEKEPVFLLPKNARMLELTLTVDQDQGSLTFPEDPGYVVTTDGSVADFTGKMLQSKKNGGFSVLPGGDIVSSEGYAMLPAEAAVISPGGEISGLTSLIGETVSGMTLREDGAVQLENQTVVTPQGQVTLPDSQELVGPSDNVILVEDGTAEELPELPDEYPAADEQPDASEEESSAASEPVSESSQEVSASEGSGEETSSGPVSSASSEEPVQEPLPEEKEPSAPPEEQAPDNALPADTAESQPVPEATQEPFGISDLATGEAWTQESIVDLFKKRTRGAQLGEKEIRDENGSVRSVPVIAPGSSGYYDFKLRNDADYDIRFTLSLSEGSFHLPIMYSLRDLENNRLYSGRAKLKANGAAVTTDYIALPAHSERRYRLNWEWQYEDWLSPWEDDEIDTAAARQKNPTYIVSMAINAEQIVPLSQGGGEGTRYPGVGKYP